MKKYLCCACNAIYFKKHAVCFLFSDGEFIKECLLDSAALICPEKKRAFENMPSQHTVTRRVEDIAGNLELQLKNRAVNFDYFSLTHFWHSTVGQSHCLSFTLPSKRRTHTRGGMLRRF